MKLTRLHSLVVISQLLIAVAVAGPLEPPKGIRHYEKGPAPEFTVTNLDGEPFTLSSVRGNWVFLHFWASWCGPCKEEMPAIQQMAEALADSSLEVVLVNTAENEDTIFSFLAEIGMDMDSLMDADGLVTEKYKPRGLPTTMLIDPEGNLQYQAIGGREWHKTKYTDFLRKLTANR
jgi:thiol-disulfide isomerase/thioredoxin